MRLTLRFNGPAVAQPILATRQIFSAGPCQVSRDASRAMALALVIAEPLPSPC